MRRIYELMLEDHLKKYDQMFFLAGPRQVGKTTLANHLKDLYKNFHYFSWDNLRARDLISKGQDAVAEYMKLQAAEPGPTVVVFDEIHEFPEWKNFMKGFVDMFKGVYKIIVTGSSKLNVYRKGGDSMMGRYFLYHMYPLTVGELVSKDSLEPQIYPQQEIAKHHFDSLWNNGGFPEPFFMDDKSFTWRWKKMRNDQLFRDDIRDFKSIQEVGQLELMASMLTLQVGQLINRLELAQKVQISGSTVSRWLQVLEEFFYCFEIKPWKNNIRRSLVKEPKVYLYDWSLVEDIGARAENFVAVHLRKFVQFNNDLGRRDYQLCYLRDKDQREVDFVVIKDNKPWFLVEVKHSRTAGLSKSLYDYQKITGAAHAFQVVFDMPYMDKDCFTYKIPMIVPAQTLLSQLV